jgi:glyoxalase family protein
MSIQGKIKGLHHVTATVREAQEDYDFYTKTLGLRLVKETVNFDDENVYHFYYADKVGTPSTVMTTFPYARVGVRQGTIGTGQVATTAFSAPAASMDFWRKHLKDHTVDASEAEAFGMQVLLFRDPSGLQLAIVGDDNDDRDQLWTTDAIGADQAIRGIHHAHLLVAEAAPTLQFLHEFGYETVKEEGNRTLLKAGAGKAGDLLVLEADPSRERGRNGLGTVHHVAHRTANIEDSLAIRAHLMDKYGILATDVKDRKYFRSIYFRIPGGVLFEIATEGPGFLVDEDEAELGTNLRLPDWQEPRREVIEQNLVPYQR